MAVVLSACTHSEVSQPTAAFYSKPAPVAVSAQKSACADSFDHALTNLTSAMKLEGTYALSQPEAQTSAYSARVLPY